ncbi:hypothetical protein BDQ12DRAFT_698267 [Crucibulum laeve]|uniref:BTB domain-containing protein n=1 Tax=Crucibulum laeve TaxID=68775 RepID=A0A5C3M1H4_9AGAR|nr:hypothetical protein BDQ12DRAFT_698267 [Crucibulum laeve]
MSISSTTSSSSCSLGSVRQVQDLWYEDGNIIFKAGDSLFKVSKGVVAARSPVFHDMLAFPQPDDQEMYDGCPLVMLYDADEDVRYFLKAIYDSGFFEPPPSTTEFDIISGILRLSTKYEVDYLRRRAIRHLDVLYPLTLTAFDRRQETRTTPWKDNTAFEAARLAREADVPWILPAVLYCVCTCPVDDMVDGYLWNDARRQLNPIDQAACVKALVPLTQADRKDMLSFLTLGAVSGCITPTDCNEARLDALRSLADAQDILNPLDSFYHMWELFEDNVCEQCVTKSKAMNGSAREAFWESLPGLFKLPDWRTLKTLQEDALRVA